MKVLFDQNFKAKMKGEWVVAHESAGEFVLDTDNVEGVTGALVEGIADANKLEVKGKTKADKIASLIEGLEGMKIPEMKEKPAQLRIEEIVQENPGLSDDELLVKIVQSGISFKLAARGMKVALEKFGMRVNNKERVQSAGSILSKMDFAPKTWGDVLDAAERIAKEVADTTEKQAMAAIKKYCKEQAIELPAKAKREKKVGAAGFKGKLADFLVNNPGATMQDLEQFLEDSGKKREISKRFAWVLNVANRLAK